LIEIDGPAHDARTQYDDRRTTWLVRHGFRVLRFAADDVLSRLDEVLEAILWELGNSAEPPPPAPPGTPPTSRGRDAHLSSPKTT
jgi:very-short-patch-repair endonuclease